jgi:hypothetical protein
MLTKGLCSIAQNTIPISNDPTNRHENLFDYTINKDKQTIAPKSVYMHDVVEIKWNHFFI